MSLERAGPIEMEIASYMAEVGNEKFLKSIKGIGERMDQSLVEEINKMKKKRESLKVLEADLAVRDGDITETERRIDLRENQVKDREAQLKRLDEELKQKNAQQRIRSSDLTKAEQQFELRVGQLNDKEAQLNKLNEDMKQKEAQLTVRSTDLKKIEHQIERRLGELNDKDAQLKRFNEELKQKQTELNTQSSSLKKAEDKIKLREVELDDKDANLKLLSEELNQKKKAASSNRQPSEWAPLSDFLLKYLETAPESAKAAAQRLRKVAAVFNNSGVLHVQVRGMQEIAIGLKSPQPGSEIAQLVASTGSDNQACIRSLGADLLSIITNNVTPSLDGSSINLGP